ncbi:MAG: FG-GAP-like repeat-containing protein [Candidatus Bipolaricaulia bacterium]
MSKAKGLMMIMLILAGLVLGGCDLLFSQAPVAIIKATPKVGQPPLSVSFDGTSSYDPDGSITSYRWDFGDGERASGPKVSHTYTGAGLFAVTLTVEDNTGKKGRDTLVIKSLSFTRLTIPVGDGPSSGALGDFDRDGDQDLFIVNQFGDEGTILLSSGDGSFRASRMALGDGPVSLEAADLDKDGLLDLAVANLIASTVSILLGNGDGSFKRFRDQAVGTAPISLTIVDLDRDGNLDIAVVNDFCDDISLLWGKGDGTFLKGNTLKDERLANLKSVTWGDFDRDGLPDLAAIAQDSANLAIFLGSGERDFPRRLLFPLGSGPGPTVVQQADLNGDGKADLIIARQSGLAVLLGFGEGAQTFLPPIEVALDLGLGLGGGPPSPSGLSLLEIDGDEHIDLALVDRFNDRVFLLLGRGDGSFEPPLSFDVGRGPTAVLGLDANGDGRLDLVTTDQEEDTLTVLLNSTP